MRNMRHFTRVPVTTEQYLMKQLVIESRYIDKWWCYIQNYEQMIKQTPFNPYSFNRLALRVFKTKIENNSQINISKGHEDEPHMH